MEIITSHLNIDFDGFACMIAAQKLYPKAKCVLPSTIETNVLNFFKAYPEIKNNFLKLSKTIFYKINLLVLVDTQQKERLGELSEILNNPNLKVHIYDHHPKISSALTGELEIYQDSGATITILVQKLKEKNISITPIEATIFALGIYEDTGSLTYISTTPEDIEMVAYLLRNKADLNIISQFINRDLTHEQLSLLNELVLSSREYNINNSKIVIAYAESNKYIGDLAILAHRLKDMGNLDVLFCIVKMADRVYLVARSRKKEVDVGEITREFGGGGHPQAASATIKDLSQNEIIDKLLKILTSKIKDQLKARDIMSSPVISIKENTSIEDIRKMTLRFNHTGFPVVNENKLIGIITRQDIERAFLHGLGSTSASGYMSQNVVTADLDSPVSVIHDLMLTKNIGRIPIIDDKKKLVGIVTRTDILQILQSNKKETSSYYEKSEQEYKNLAKYLKSRLALKILNILIKAGETAKSLSFSAYVVGGFVRDIIMGNKNLDIDLVIEGSGIEFAEKFAKIYNANVISHFKFGTAIITFPDGFRIDVATARTEFYEYPTALPKVESSSIKYDLYRRDFTINAIAIMLNPEEFGKSVDFFSGIKDIKKGIIRVLYNLSFIDDPTRIFRAIRFEQRLHFKIDKQTEHFIDNALKLGVLDKIANERVRDELMLILSEEKPGPAFKRMAELNILTLIHPNLIFTLTIEKNFNDIFEVFNWFKLLFLQIQVEYWIVYFIALLKDFNELEVNEILEKFKFNRKYINIITARGKVFSVEENLKISKNILPSEIYRILFEIPKEIILFIMGSTKNIYVKKKISLYLTHYFDEKISITGDDLISLGISPSAQFKNILNEVLYARLDGKLKTKADEIKFAKEYAMQK